MYKIAVCDNSESALKRTKSLLDLYANRRKLVDFEILTFNGSFDFMDAIEKGLNIQILIIETYMNGVSGIQVARMLKKMKYNIPVIFLTSDKSYALDAFEVDAAQYLIKGNEKESLFRVLDQLYDPVRQERRRKILLSARDGIYNIFMRDIMYAESRKNYQMLVLEDGTKLEVRITGKDLAAKLEENISFKRCGSSYIVNWFYLKALTADYILMEDNTEIPVPRGKYSQLREIYESFHQRILTR